MIVAALLVFASVFGSVIETKPSPVFAEVFIGGQGPFRFLVDTGSQTSLIDRRLAERLGLKAQFRVNVVTPLGTSLLPGTRAADLRIGTTALPAVELVFQNLAEARRLYPVVGPAINGLLGIHALA